GIDAGQTVNLAGFRKHLKYIEDTYPNPLYLGMGDYIDFMSPSNRDSIKKSKIYSQSREYIEDSAVDLANKFISLVEHTRGKWLGLLTGHHFYELKDGTTTDQHIASWLDAPYLGRCAHITVKYVNKNGKTDGHLNIWAHHGEGVRKYPAGKIIDNVAPHWPEVDLFFMGHMHESDSARIARYVVDSAGDIVTRNSLAVVTGAWLEPYTAHVGSYIEDQVLRPRATGAPVVVVEPYFDEKGRRKKKFRYISEV
ncbi:MAG: hypothetical protein V3T23_11270, partial [Nitrososphaerales archaeon]